LLLIYQKPMGKKAVKELILQQNVTPAIQYFTFAFQGFIW